MKSLVLIPYCPYPVNSGAKSIFIKHLSFLKEWGKCDIASSEIKPVGGGWREEYKKTVIEQGFALSLIQHRRITLKYLIAIMYAVLFKSLSMEKAFGHSNPYHRYAFSKDWWFEQTQSKNIAEIHYSFWAYLPCACPKVVVVHDLWSDIMWEGSRKETAELKTADLIVTLSSTDRFTLLKRGLTNVHWSPPCVEGKTFLDSTAVAIVGSSNRHNREGLQWLRNAKNQERLGGINLNCYGEIAKYIEKNGSLLAKGNYLNTYKPYEECGVVLMLTANGTGIQIKGIEALASGRAIIARNGAMRGLPGDEKGWIEVDTPEEMIELIKRVVSDSSFRYKLMDKSKAYYQMYLEKSLVLKKLKSKYQKICAI